jgi:hypothetical protein
MSQIILGRLRESTLSSLELSLVELLEVGNNMIDSTTVGEKVNALSSAVGSIVGKRLFGDKLVSPLSTVGEKEGDETAQGPSAVHPCSPYSDPGAKVLQYADRGHALHL